MGNPVIQWQIVTKAPDQSAKFYGALFEWETNRDNLLGYQIVDTGSELGISGGIWPAPPETPPFVQLFIQVDNCETYVERAKELGARVIVPAQVLPDGDQMAILHDPQGLSFGIVSRSPA
jgi:predicted enzyme related to lactoylglutathione lyase